MSCYEDPFTKQGKSGNDKVHVDDTTGIMQEKQAGQVKAWEPQTCDIVLQIIICKKTKLFITAYFFKLDE